MAITQAPPAVASAQSPSAAAVAPKRYLARLIGGVALLAVLLLVDVLFAPPGWWQIKLQEYQRQRLLVYRLPPPNVVKNRRRFHHLKPVGIEKMLGLRALGQNIDDMIGFLERRHQFRFRDHGNTFIAPDSSAKAYDFHFEWGEQFDEPLANRAKTQNQHRLPPQRAAVLPQPAPFVRAVRRVASQGPRQIPCLRQHETQDLRGAGFVVNARAVGQRNAAFRQHRAKSRVVIARDSRTADVNPLQLLRPQNRLGIGLAKGNVRGKKLRVGFRLGQNGGGGSLRKVKFMSRRFLAQQCQRSGRQI